MSKSFHRGERQFSPITGLAAQKTMVSSKNPTTVIPGKTPESRSEDEEPPDPGRVSTRTPSRRSTPNQTLTSNSSPELLIVPAAERTAIPLAPGLGTLERRAVRRAGRLPFELAEVDVVVLFTRTTTSKRWDAQELLADEENAQVARLIAEVLEPHTRSIQLRACRRDVEACLRDLDPARHLIFNLYEGQVGRTGDEVAAARYLQERGFIHTGAPYAALARTCNKWTTKKIVAAAGLPTPAYVIIRKPEEWQGQLSAPLIVKPIAEEGSIGITQSSLARTAQDVRPLIEASLAKYRQALIVEEFVTGREINAALWGNHTPQLLPIAEIAFTWTDDPLQQFVTYASKWISDSPEYTGTPGICPARLSARDRKAIERVATGAWRELRLSGYARVDIRLRDGIPYILEVNGNPDLAPDAGFFRSAAAAGFNWEGMIQHIAQLALDSQR
ncbi:MAG: ATP-grasp domain-containing protein [Anaerolineales bacterium]|jgi:D-alanine-D-alanine ligase